MIDPILALTFNLHAHPGTYALLLGSGISRTAGIPTGWEVTLDLTAKLAHIQGEGCEGQEAEWYEGKFGKAPDYADLLSAIAPTSAAQQQLLKGYFEPTPEEREDGKKIPTAAHRAIARLVAGGYVRVVATTNFDRLLEAALEAEGVSPIVVASPDAVKGAPPLAHSKCTIVKVHGDYLDHRIKNSPDDLAKYDSDMDRLLDQVFDEYGLIVSGWSAEYDVALRAALQRARSRRYPLYWSGVSEPRGAAKELIAFLTASFIQVEGSDQFFTALVEKVNALREFDRPHPLTTQAAVAAVKRYLSDDRHSISLRDFLIEEARSSGAAIDDILSNSKRGSADQKAVSDLLNRFEAACEKLIHIFALGGFYARTAQARPFFDAFSIIVSRAALSEGYNNWPNLRRYPSLLLIYAVGIAAVASDNFPLLLEIAIRRSFARLDGERMLPAPSRFYTHEILDRDAGRKFLPDMDRRYTPVSDYLRGKLRGCFASLIPVSAQYDRHFDDFEYLWCLLHVDTELQRGASDPWTPYGAFVWKRREREDDWYGAAAQRAVENSDPSWAPLAGGLFGGSIDRLSAAVRHAQPALNRLSAQMW